MARLPTQLEQTLFKLEQQVAPVSTSTPEAPPNVFSSPQSFWTYVQSQPKLEQTDTHDFQSAHIDSLSGHHKHCSDLKARLDDAVGVLVEVENQHHLVSQKTNSLHETCKKLLAEQSAFDNVVSEIEAPLQYLREIDRIGKLFGVGNERPLHPDTEEFQKAVQRVDECLEYVERNPQFRDHREHLLKFTMLYNKGLSMVREYVCKSIMSLTSSVEAALNVNAVSKLGVQGTTQYTLLYVRFQVLAGQLKPCIELLEERAHKPEGREQLRLCEDCLSSCRLRLLRDIVNTSTALTQPTELIPKLRLAFPYLLQTCQLERTVFNAFFTPPDTSDQEVNQTAQQHNKNFASEVYDTLQFDGEDGGGDAAGGYGALVQGLCNMLYDRVRPLVVRQGSVDKLCEAVRVVETELQISNSEFKKVMSIVLADLQERLFYCTSMFIRENILNFAPSKTDLDYPKKLITDRTKSKYNNTTAETAKPSAPAPAPKETETASTPVDSDAVPSESSKVEGAATVVDSKDVSGSGEAQVDAVNEVVTGGDNVTQSNGGNDVEVESGDLSNGQKGEAVEKKEAVNSYEDLYSGWYPSLESTLMCLSKVFRCLDHSTFDDLTQEAVQACTQSLFDAAKAINSNVTVLSPTSATHHNTFENLCKTTKIDSQLFLVKHLLILREQITPFNSALRVKQQHLDYSPTFDAFSHFLAHSREILAMNRHNPLIELFQHGVPKIQTDEVDTKRDLEGLLRTACDDYILTSYTFVLGALLAFLQNVVTAVETSKPLPTGEVALGLLRSNSSTLPDRLDALKEKTGLYLVNKQTRAILFQPIRTNVFKRMTELLNTINEHYKNEENFAEMVTIVSNLRTKVTETENQQ